jgi:hypothetical protein
MENQSPILSVKPEFLFWQEVASQWILIFIVCVLITISVSYRGVGLMILPAIALIIGFFIYCEQKKLLVAGTYYLFFEDYLVIHYNNSGFVRNQSITIEYREISKLSITQNIFEESLKLCSIPFKRGSTPWYFSFTNTYSYQKMVLYPYYYRPYLSMWFYFSQDLSKCQLWELSNIPQAKEVYALLTEKTQR